MKLSRILFLFLFTGICSLTAQPQSPRQKYIQVEAQRRQYNGGNVKYAPYEPFQTRTIAQLADYRSPKKSVKLSKYGG